MSAPRIPIGDALVHLSYCFAIVFRTQKYLTQKLLTGSRNGSRYNFFKMELSEYERYENLRDREYKYCSNKDEVRGLFTEGIKTLPVVSCGGTLGFRYDDIEYPNGGTQAFLDYESECNKKNVIPYSYLELRYHWWFGKAVFMLSRQEPLRLARSANQALAEGFLKGGRIHILSIGLDSNCVGEFFKCKLPEVLEQGYRLHYSRLFGRSHMNAEWGCVPEILLEVEKNRGRLRLKLGKSPAPDEAQILSDWFGKLTSSATETQLPK